VGDDSRAARSPRGPRPGIVFPRWTNRLREISAVAAVGGLIYVVVLVTLVFGPDNSAIGYAPEQPVPYSHQVHAGDLDIDCRYCHNTVEQGAKALIPPAATCMNCHKTILPESEKLAPVRRSFETGEPVRWVRVHDLPDFVYFDHSAHLNAGVGCASCHGRIDRMEVVRQDKPLNMAWCLECHRNPAGEIVPREAVTQLAHARDPELGAVLVDEYDLTPAVDCSTCHR
jgi:hypothetical protein